MSDEVVVKRGRGRPKGSKNKPKDGSILPPPVPVVVEPEPVITPVNGKTCKHCQYFLTCKKFKGKDGNICDTFKDNFPDEEEVEAVAILPEEQVVLHKCSGITEACAGCVHATPHDPNDYYFPINDISRCSEVSEVCEDVGIAVKCVPV